MLNESFRIHHGGTRDTVGVEWTAPGDDWLSCILANGRVVADAFAPGTAHRSIDVPLTESGSAVLEVHDFAPGDQPDDAPESVMVAPEPYAFPRIVFAAVPGAARYRLYHRPEGEGETRVWEGVGDPIDEYWIGLPCPVELEGDGGDGRAGRWHFLRVEAVSEYGVESACGAWAWRAYGVPAASSAAVEPGDEPGRYTFRLR